jgi:predicted lipid-binding transport protein (Tim44 family)
MKDFKLALYGVGSLAAVILAGLALMHLISGETLALFVVLLGLSVTIARVVMNNSTPQQSVASMLRDDTEAPRNPAR